MAIAWLPSISTSGFLDQAEQAARDANVAVEFRSQSAAELTEKGHFDFVLAHWHVIGFMRNEEIKLVKGYKDFAKNPARLKEFSIFVCHK